MMILICHIFVIDCHMWMSGTAKQSLIMAGSLNRMNICFLAFPHSWQHNSRHKLLLCQFLTEELAPHLWTNCQCTSSDRQTMYVWLYTVSHWCVLRTSLTLRTDALEAVPRCCQHLARSLLTSSSVCCCRDSSSYRSVLVYLVTLWACHWVNWCLDCHTECLITEMVNCLS